ncbi:MAG: alpha-amylase [Acidobacteria bacterium]|nr:alpha-amylase [Acidobacteriota bacterium]MBI3658649.1 alpha-amylase [Acidobacteriota bacterium]
MKFAWLTLIWLLSVGWPYAQPPAVTKVEPPSWWREHSINPVRVLIRGQHLQGAALTVPVGLSIAGTTVNPQGTYIFADMTIHRDTPIGPTSLRIATAGGETSALFEILPPLARAGRFQGLTEDDAIYLIMVDRFADGDPRNDNPEISPGLCDRAKPRYYHGGDFQGIIDHLPYLKDLGITAIWLTPIYDNVNHVNPPTRYDSVAGVDYHGYGAVDYYAVEEHFGTLTKYRELVDAAHRIGIKVIQDQVANHTGPFHPWVEDSPTPTWFHGTKAHHLNNNWQTWTLMDPYASAALRRPVLEGWFINILPDLNQEDSEVARYLIQNSLWWVGISGEDAIRQDTLPYVPRRFWRDWTAALAREFPNVTVIGEVLNKSVPLVSFFQKGRTQHDGIDTGIHTVFDYPLFFAMRRVFGQGKPMTELPELLAMDYLYPSPHRLVTLIGSHDVKRFLNEEQASPVRLRMAFTALLTLRGIPQLYYGDEIGLRGERDPDNRRDFPGGFPGDRRNAFTKVGLLPDEQIVYGQVKTLLGLRREIPALRRGALVTLAAGDHSLVYARTTPTQAVLIAFNNAAQPLTLEVDVQALPWQNSAKLVDRLADQLRTVVTNGKVTLRIPAFSSAVFAPE